LNSRYAKNEETIKNLIRFAPYDESISDPNGVPFTKKNNQSQVRVSDTDWPEFLIGGVIAWAIFVFIIRKK